MVVGRGMIANAFLSYEESKDVLVFASGVSNSLLNDENDFQRERELLVQSIQSKPEATVVYFGTCSVDDPELCESPYVLHKREMEKLVQKNASRYFVFRLSQVVGMGSSPTLINFIVDRLRKKETFDVWRNSSRNLIDVDDVFKIADYLIKNRIYENKITNIAAPFSLSIFEIVAIVEDFLGYEGSYEILEKGGSYTIETNEIAPLAKDMGVCFDEKYPASIIKKYFFNA